MSDAEMYSKVLSGLRVAEQEIVIAVGHRTGISNFSSLIGAILFNASVIELRRLASEYLMSQGTEGAIAAFARVTDGSDIEELRMFIDEGGLADEAFLAGDQAVTDDSPKAKK